MMDDLFWIVPSVGLVCIASLAVCIHSYRLKKRLELENLEPVMFPHPHPRPPLPPSRISSLTNLVELVIEPDEEHDPI